MEDVERRSQPYSDEYDWLGPDPTRNNRGQYILIFLVVLINPTCMVLITRPESGSHYPPYVWRLIQSVYDHTFSASVRHMKEVYYMFL